MADPHLFFEGEFSHGSVKGGQVEQRVESKAVFPPWRRDDEAFANPFRREGLPAFAVKEDGNAPETRGSPFLGDSL